MVTDNKQLQKIDKKTIAQIKDDLTKRKKQILDDLELIIKKDKKENEDKEDKEDLQRTSFPDFGNKQDENAQEISEYSTNLATEKVLRSALRDIDNALDRIKQGTYGICKYCGNEIGKKRMLARPVASTCIECKTKLQSTT